MEKKYGRIRQVTGGNIIRSVHFACSVTRATDIHPEHVILLFHSNSEYANVAQYYVTCTLHVLLTLATQSRIARGLHLECLRETEVQQLLIRSLFNDAASNSRICRLPRRTIGW